jgi:two-component system, cell cycle sensor histidine kinase and response regulator CckA
MTLFSVVLIVSFGLLWIWQAISDTQKQYGEIREKYLEEQKARIKNETDRVAAYIELEKSLTEKRLKSTIKARTEEAYQTALYIYEQNRETKSPVEVKKLVHDALYAASWDNGRGYYFALDMQGKGIVNRNRPDHEGADLFDLKDDQGTYFMRDFIATAKSDDGEGFCSYNWTMPHAPEELTRKTSYVKYFPPFDWILGTGRYVADEKKQIQQEVLERVEQIRYGDDGYLFIGQWDGVTLSGPAKGKNMIGTTDVNGVKIVEELIERAKDGGGFVSYVMPALEGKQQAPKISYAAPVTDWQWYVGTGVYLDAMDKVIAAKQQALSQSVKAFIGKSILILLGLLLLSWSLSLFLSRRISRNLHAFSEFFRQTAANDQPIAEDSIAFYEFHSMAIAANRMAEERRKAWVALEESQQRFLQVLDAAHIPLVIVDHEQHIHLLNRKFTQLFGYTQGELADLGEWWSRACPDPVLRAELSKKWDAAMAVAEREGEPLVGFMMEACCADRSLRVVEMDCGQVGTWWLISFQDLTEQLQAEEEKKCLETKLAQAQKMEAIGLLAGGVAHDLNNILSGIVSYPELLLMQLPSDSKLRKSIQAIHESGKRAAEVVADLLTIARGIAAAREALNVNDLIAEFLRSPECQRIVILHPGVRLVTELDPALGRISCSAIHIRKILLNLVLNAAEAISGPGTVTLETRARFLDEVTAAGQGLKTGECVQLLVRDTGMGIAPQDLGRIFEPFYTKKVMGKSGTGLGLAVVWNTIQEHGGTITVESSGAGTSFLITLPVTAEKKAPSLTHEDLESYRGSGEKILVVDDESQQRDIASNYLAHLGYEVESVASGEKALEYLETTSVDLVLLDMLMEPGMSGGEAYEQIVRLHPGQKAVIASGFAETEEVQKALALGVCQFIKKPYTLQEIAVAVFRALRTEGGGPV